MKYLIFLLLPKALLSRFLGRLERLESPQWFVHPARAWFARRYKLNMAEAEHGIEHYPSLNKLFTRKLKAGVRPIRGELVHPCDAVISQAGPLVDGRLLQTSIAAKGWTYSAEELIGKPLGASMDGGSFATYYLCPTDYHRVHFPISGEVKSIRLLVGKLWPVNEWSVGNVRNLFCANERVVFEVQSKFGLYYMVMVGATNVGRISTWLAPELTSNLNWRRASAVKTFDQPPPVQVGDEAGIFEMGSTVIMVMDRALSSKVSLKQGRSRLGESISKT